MSTGENDDKRTVPLNSSLSEKVSVVVPVFNVEAYLEQCLDSIAAQTYRETEVIMVDDGSTDLCGEICDRYAEKDNRFRVIHKPNGGLVSARKAGLAQATGTYVTYVDSDDFIEADLLENCVRKIKETGADILLHGYKRDDGTEVIPKANNLPDGVYEGNVLKRLQNNMLSLQESEKRRSPADPQGKETPRFFRFGVEPAVWAKLFRRDLLEKHQLRVPDDITIGEDAAVTYPLLKDCKKAVIDNNLNGYHYRMSPDSMTRAFNKDYFRRISVLFVFLQESLNTGEDENAKNALDDYRIYLIRTELEKIRYTATLSKKEKRNHLREAATNQPVLRNLKEPAKRWFSGELLRRMEWAEQGDWEKIERSYVKENIKSAIYNLCYNKQRKENAHT